MLDDGWTDRWMSPGQSHLLAPDPGHSKEAPWWQVGRGLGSGGLWLNPHGLGKTLEQPAPAWTGSGSPPSCVPLGQWCELSESCVHGRSQSPGHLLGPPREVTVPSSKVGHQPGFLLQQQGLTRARPQEAQGRSSEPSWGKQTGHRYQEPRGQGKRAQASRFHGRRELGKASELPGGAEEP